LMPDPATHKGEVGALLGDVSPQPPAPSVAYDGTAKSFVPYLEDITAGIGGFPLSCGIITKYPVLLQTTQLEGSGAEESEIPRVECDDPKYQLPTSVAVYNRHLAQLESSPGICGGTGDLEVAEFAYNQYAADVVRLNPMGVTAATYT
ncbi:hypothetical protein, partial [Phocaeicola dorei]|uniref:hypothetical protein n=1 Tax=Phocaeicola dorei TaxID=357276 RepID=UPI001BDDEE3D